MYHYNSAMQGHKAVSACFTKKADSNCLLALQSIAVIIFMFVCLGLITMNDNVHIIHKITVYMCTGFGNTIITFTIHRDGIGKEMTFECGMIRS